MASNNLNVIASLRRPTRVGSSKWLERWSNPKEIRLTMRTSSHTLETHERTINTTSARPRSRKELKLTEKPAGGNPKRCLRVGARRWNRLDVPRRADAVSQGVCAGKSAGRKQRHRKADVCGDTLAGTGRKNQSWRPSLTMNTCPKCGHKWHDEKRASGGKARWRGMSKKQRSQAASDAAKARWAKRSNACVSHPGTDAHK